jgi:hypothetical protein
MLVMLKNGRLTWIWGGKDQVAISTLPLSLAPTNDPVPICNDVENSPRSRRWKLAHSHPIWCSCSHRIR